VVGALVAEGLGEHGLDVIVVGLDGRALLGEQHHLVEDLLELLAALGRHRGHRGAELLDLLGAELLEHFGGLVGAQGHQEQGALVEPFIVAAHCFPSIP
jgi:hypothetical protein